MKSENRLMEAIDKHGPITAKALAKRMRVAKVTVHRQLNKGARWYGKKKLVSELVREGKTGPMARAYRLVRG